MTIDEKVLQSFYDIISESKQNLYDKIAAERTNHITVVLENTQKDHNASAVLRTCDCFGIQGLHAIEKNTDYAIQREIARGAGNWVDLHTYSKGPDLTKNTLLKLKEKGYKIVSTSPHASDDINSLDLSDPIALVFGTEREGISPDVMELSDTSIRIPLYGFTESFNVSVSVAIILNTLRQRLESSSINWKLSKREQIRLKIDWCTKIIRNGEAVEKEIRKRVLVNE